MEKNCENCKGDRNGNRPCDNGEFCETNFLIQSRNVYKNVKKSIGKLNNNLIEDYKKENK